MVFGVSQAEPGDNSSPCLRFVSCQQAPSGAPKCTICDHQVRGAITLCPAASDDEKVLGHFSFGWQGKTGTRCHDDGNVFPHRTDRAEIRAVRSAVIFPARLACSFRVKRGQPSRSLDRTWADSIIIDRPVRACLGERTNVLTRMYHVQPRVKNAVHN